MKTYKIDDIFSEKVDKGSLFILRTKEDLKLAIDRGYEEFEYKIRNLGGKIYRYDDSEAGIDQITASQIQNGRI